MSETTWYLRENGRVTGPFTRQQLESLQTRGRLGRFAELSHDRQSWRRAVEVFSPPRATADAKPEAAKKTQTADAGSYDLLDGEPAGADPNDPREAYAWYYARGKTPTGPVRYTELRRLAAAGELTPQTKVWNETMSDWEPANQVTNFQTYGTPVNDEVPTQPPPPPNAPPRAIASETARPHELGHANSERPISVAAVTGFLLGLMSWGVSGLFFLTAVVMDGVQISNAARGTIALVLIGVASLSGLLGIIFSSVGINKTLGAIATRRGMGLAIAGLILGSLILFLWVVFMTLVMLGVISEASTRAN